MGYLTNFIIYMLAMAGVLTVALLVFKYTTGGGNKFNKGKCLKVLDTLSLGARKTLYIISAGEEKFLIAGDADRTTLISKLNPINNSENKISAVMTSETNHYPTESFQENIKTLSRKINMDKSITGIHTTQTSPYNSVMRSLANKMGAGINE